MYNTNPLHGELTIPGDKSISHRSVMFASLAKGTSLSKAFYPVQIVFPPSIVFDKWALKSTKKKVWSPSQVKVCED